jgi:hypothetical protein
MPPHVGPNDAGIRIGHNEWQRPQTEKPLAHNAGVWVDHRKAVIVLLGPDGDKTLVINSKVEKHLERSGDSPLKGAYEALQVPADDSRQRAFTGELNSYYDAVIAALSDTESLLIIGPGEAKGELHKRLTRIKPAMHMVATETEDKMTDRQIAAKVRSHFGRAAPRMHQAR